MADNTQDLVLERLKQIQAEQAAARERDREIIARLGQLESAVAHIGRYQADTRRSSPTGRLSTN